jgi:hypothetical protein
MVDADRRCFRYETSCAVSVKQNAPPPLLQANLGSATINPYSCIARKILRTEA